MVPVSASELIKLIGKDGRFKANGFFFEVRVIDARSDRAGIEYLVIPLAGEGRCWVASCLIDLRGEKE